MRIKSQLFALVLSVLVPASLAAIAAILYVYHEEQATQETSFREAARSFAHLIDSDLRSRQSILSTLANAPSLASGDLSTFYEFAKKTAPTPDTTVILIEPSGKQLLNTRAPLGTALPSRRNAIVSEQMERQGAATPLVSDVFLSSIGKRFDFLVQIPLLEQGGLKYFLAMGVNASAIQKLIVEQKLPTSWLGAIVDRRGVVLARSRDPDKFVGRSTDERLQHLFTSNRDGVTRSVTLDGITVKTFYHRIPASDWTVVLSIPETEIRRSAIRGAGYFAAVAILLLIVCLLAARAIGVGVIAKMRRLEQAAESLGRGEQVDYDAQGLVEVDGVGRRIAEASSRLSTSQRDLELRVQQAVAETERAQNALLHSQKMEALGRLTGGIAHEFNNLLQTLATSMQLAKRSKDIERVHALLDTCSKALKRAKALTGQLSSFGRVQDARMETVSLQQHIAEFRQLVDNVLPATVKLDIQVSSEEWAVAIDPTQFELAFLNLVINAKDAMPAGGSIRVEVINEASVSPGGTLPVADYVCVRFSDSGVGMNAEVLAKALDPFFTTKKVGEGTGLGLPQAFGFARQAGGVLLLRSREGVGTQVDVYLPRATGDFLSVGEAVVAGPQAHKTEGGSLLFVEDDPLVRESVAPALEGAGFFVIMAESADAALACLDAGTKVDYVFSDVVMPGSLNGIDLARLVITRFPHIKVVLATGYSENRVSMPSVQVLAKPYDLTDLIRVLRR